MGNVNILILVVLFASFSVFSEVGTIGDLDNLQKERVLYEAKAALNKAKVAANGGGSGDVFTGGGTAAKPVTNGNVVNVLPSLVKVSGNKAVVSMPDGNSISVTTGQMLPGGRWQVSSIGLQGVKIRSIDNNQIQILN